MDVKDAKGQDQRVKNADDTISVILPPTSKNAKIVEKEEKREDKKEEDAEKNNEINDSPKVDKGWGDKIEQEMEEKEKIINEEYEEDNISEVEDAYSEKVNMYEEEEEEEDEEEKEYDYAASEAFDTSYSYGDLEGTNYKSEEYAEFAEKQDEFDGNVSTSYQVSEKPSETASYANKMEFNEKKDPEGSQRSDILFDNNNKEIKTNYEKLGENVNKFCVQQIQIPPGYPKIIKEFSKAAIRTRPRDLLTWSYSYFCALSNGEIPPAKARLEYPLKEASSGLTLGILRVLYRQLSGCKFWPIEEIRQKWAGLCLNCKELECIFSVILKNTDEKDVISLNQFMALAAGTLGSNIIETMTIICKTMTNRPDGAEPYICFQDWWEMYTFLNNVNEGIPQDDQIDEIFLYLSSVVGENDNLIGPRDFLYQECPQL